MPCSISSTVGASICASPPGRIASGTVASPTIRFLPTGSSVSYYVYSNFFCPGNDIPGANFRLAINQESLCALKCHTFSDCVAFGYSPSTGDCWLKTNLIITRTDNVFNCYVLTTAPIVQPRSNAAPGAVFFGFTTSATPANSFSGNGAITPTVCPENSFSAQGSAKCTCNAGYSQIGLFYIYRV